MSTDIHFVIEQLDGDKWIGLVSSSYLNIRTCPIKCENYEFFRNLAGVRGNYDKPLLGVPKDASDLTKLKVKQWGVDGHSHSYVDLKYFVHVYMQSTDGFTPEHSLIPEHSVLGFCFSEDEIKQRVVFWFDN